MSTWESRQFQAIRIKAMAARPKTESVANMKGLEKPKISASFASLREKRISRKVRQDRKGSDLIRENF